MPMDAYPIIWKEYGLTDEDTVANVETTTKYHYFGYLNIKHGWYIRRFDIHIGSHRYCFGAKNYQEAWENRDQLQYKYVDEVHG